MPFPEYTADEQKNIQRLVGAIVDGRRNEDEGHDQRVGALLAVLKPEDPRITVIEKKLDSQYISRGRKYATEKYASAYDIETLFRDHVEFIVYLNEDDQLKVANENIKKSKGHKDMLAARRYSARKFEELSAMDPNPSAVTEKGFLEYKTITNLEGFMRLVEASKIPENNIRTILLDNARYAKDYPTTYSVGSNDVSERSSASR